MIARKRVTYSADDPRVGPRKRALCPICSKMRPVKKDGTFVVHLRGARRGHSGTVWIHRSTDVRDAWNNTCPGSGTKAVAA